MAVIGGIVLAAVIVVVIMHMPLADLATTVVVLDRFDVRGGTGCSMRIDAEWRTQQSNHYRDDDSDLDQCCPCKS